MSKPADNPFRSLVTLLTEAHDHAWRIARSILSTAPEKRISDPLWQESSNQRWARFRELQTGARHVGTSPVPTDEFETAFMAAADWLNHLDAWHNAIKVTNVYALPSLCELLAKHTPLFLSVQNLLNEYADRLDRQPRGQTAPPLPKKRERKRTPRCATLLLAHLEGDKRNIGKSIPQLADDLGVNKSTISRALKHPDFRERFAELKRQSTMTPRRRSQL